MATMVDTILGEQAYGRWQEAPMVDLKQGGQHGPSTQFDTYLSSTAYVRRNLVAVLLDAPVGFQMLPNPDKWVEALKALVEVQPLTIEGLQAGLTVDTVETPMGGGGEIHQDPAGVTRARSQVTFTWKERYGKPISRFHSEWITNLIGDPITKAPAVVSLGAGAPSDLLPNFYGMTCLFFEPDPTYHRVQEAWLGTNMWPLSTGDIIGRRDLSSPGEGQDLSIEYTGIYQHGYGVRRFAQMIYEQFDLGGMNPNLQKAFMDGIGADVQAASSGYAEMLDKISSERVPGA